MDITQLREKIDNIDDQLVNLFTQRMEITRDIAAYKKENNLPIYVPARERQKLQEVAKLAGPDMDDYTRVLYSMIFELSRSYQSKQNSTATELYRKITDSIENTSKLFPQAPMVACQGVEGAYSQIACEKIFKNPMIMYFKNFDAIFGAIEQGLCQYGILPIENSTAGSVKKVYDLMIHHNFSIVRTFRLKIDHNLLAKPGTKLSDIQEIYSHEQAINQCSDFLKNMPGVKIFKNPMIMYFKNFDAIFGAIEQGLCQYGILPIENSTAGSVKKVYDLMIHHNFSIVRTFRLKIDHNLLAKPGTKLSDIQEIYSHEQAINQCSDFLKNMPGVKIIPVENTAVAAQMVAQSQDNHGAAISSKGCEEIYGLCSLADSIQDKGNNRTRFICISKNLEIYPGADKTSIMMVLPHKPGALYKVLARLYVLGINVIKLESRPIPDRDFEFMFYFDLETSIYSQEFVQLMCELDDLCEEFKYLGSYSEVV